MQDVNHFFIKAAATFHIPKISIQGSALFMIFIKMQKPIDKRNRLHYIFIVSVTGQAGMMT